MFALILFGLREMCQAKTEMGPTGGAADILSAKPAGLVPEVNITVEPRRAEKRLDPGFVIPDAEAPLSVPALAEAPKCVPADAVPPLGERQGAPGSCPEWFAGLLPGYQCFRPGDRQGHSGRETGTPKPGMTIRRKPGLNPHPKLHIALTSQFAVIYRRGSSWPPGSLRRTGEEIHSGCF